MAGKQPAFMFYTGDWLKDPNLGKCSPATRGIWLDMLCLMHENERSGELTGTVDQLARICRATPDEINDALEELTVTKTGCVTPGHGEVTITNRRMQKDRKARDGAAERQRRRRGGDACHANVTTPLSSSPSSSVQTDRELSDHDDERIAAIRGDFGSNATARRTARGRRTVNPSAVAQCEEGIERYLARKAKT